MGGTEVGYGIRLKGDANGFVAESTRAGKSMGEVVSAADKAATAATAAAEAISGIAEQAGKAATATDQLGKAETATAVAGEKSAVAHTKSATAAAGAASSTREASKAVEVLGKSHAVATVEQQKSTSATQALSKAHADAGQAAEISAGQMTMARRIVTSNLINIGNVAVATKGDIAAMASPLPDVIYGLRMMGVGFSGAAAVALGATAAVIGAVALVGSRVAETASRTRELTVALKAMGDTSGISGEQLRKMSEDAASRGPFSRAESFSAAKTLAFHRQLSGEVMKGIMEAGVDLATATGNDLSKTVDMLAGAFEKGYAGIRELDDQLGILTASEVEQIRTMTEHGHQAEALGIAMDALKRRVKGLAEEGMSDGAKAFRDLANAWNELMDKVAGSDTVLTMMRGAASVFRDLSSLAGKTPAPDIGQQVAQKSRQLIEAERRREELEGNSSLGGYGQRMAQEARAEVERLRKEIDELVNRGRAQVAELEAGAAKAQANATKAAVQQSAKAISDLADQMDKQRQILQAPAPTRELVRARLQAEDYAKDKKLTAPDGDRAKDLFVGGARDQISAAARDAAMAVKLEADAQERLATAAGLSAEAVRRAGVENKVAAFAYQYAGSGVKQYAEQLWRAYEAEQAMRWAEWKRQVDLQVVANDNLSAAYRQGTAAAIEHAERENEIREVIERTGASYTKAAQEVDRLRTSRKALEADRTLWSLRRDVADAETLTDALRSGDPAAARRAQIDAQSRRFATDNRLQDDDSRVMEYRSLKEREYSDQLRRSAIDTNRAMDASFRYREEMAKLNEQRATGVLTEKAYAEEWKRIEREKLEASKDFVDGATRAIWDYAEQAGNAAKRAETFFGNAFKSMEDALVKFVKTGKMDFASLADSIISDLIRMQIQAQITGPLSQALSSGMGSFLGGLFGGGESGAAGATPVPDTGNFALAHTGGVIGQDSLVRRQVDHTIFNNAVRYHIGGLVGLRPGEVPIIANQNEEVLTEDNPRHIFNAARRPNSAQGGGTVVNMDVQIIDQRSAEQPAVQVSQGKGPDGRDLLRIVIPALRKDIASRGEVAQTFEQAYDLRRKSGGG